MPIVDGFSLTMSAQHDRGDCAEAKQEDGGLILFRPEIRVGGWDRTVQQALLHEWEPPRPNQELKPTLTAAVAKAARAAQSVSASPKVIAGDVLSAVYREGPDAGVHVAVGGAGAVAARRPDGRWETYEIMYTTCPLYPSLFGENGEVTTQVETYRADLPGRRSVTRVSPGRWEPFHSQLVDEINDPWFPLFFREGLFDTVLLLTSGALAFRPKSSSGTEHAEKILPGSVIDALDIPRRPGPKFLQKAVVAFEATARKRWEHRGSLAIGGIAFP